MSSDDVCVIVPVYNEATTVAAIVSDLLHDLRPRRVRRRRLPDGSADLARAAGATVLRHVVNHGQGAALRTGFDYVLRHTDAAYAVTFDADGQHLVEDAQRMVRAARDRAASTSCWPRASPARTARDAPPARSSSSRRPSGSPG